MEIVLHYIGNGSFIPGIPARDLTRADMEHMEIDVTLLIESGLYLKVENKKQTAKSGNEVKNGSR